MGKPGQQPPLSHGTRAVGRRADEDVQPPILEIGGGEDAAANREGRLTPADA